MEHAASAHQDVGHDLVPRLMVGRLLQRPLVLDPHPFLAEGMEVEVIRGPLAGVRGKLLRKDRVARLVLAVTLIRQAAVVEIHPADAEMHGITNNMPVRVTSRRGEIVLRATVTEKTTVGVAFIPWHFAEAAANLLTNDALDPEAKIPEFKACAVQVFPAREDELKNPEAVVNRGRY